MPLVQFSITKKTENGYNLAISELVHKAIIEVFNFPSMDRFQIFTKHNKDSLIYESSYPILGNYEPIIIQITLYDGRTTEVKQLLYKRVRELLFQGLGIQPNNVLINLVETKEENWSCNHRTLSV